MTTTESIKRLSFTISKQNKPNATDAEALNKIIQFVNQTSKETIQENRLFAKVYIFLLQELSVYYKSVDLANREINKILSLNSVEILCKDLTAKLNQIESQRYLENGTNGQAWIESTETWDLDSTIAHVNHTITESINNYKNLD
jgi:hypothetical protein